MSSAINTATRQPPANVQQATVQEGPFGPTYGDTGVAPEATFGYYRQGQDKFSYCEALTFRRVGTPSFKPGRLGKPSDHTGPQRAFQQYTRVMDQQLDWENRTHDEAVALETIAELPSESFGYGLLCNAKEGAAERAAIDQALLREPMHGDLNNRKGAICYEAGDYDAAFVHRHRSVTLNPTHMGVRDNYFAAAAQIPQDRQRTLLRNDALHLETTARDDEMRNWLLFRRGLTHFMSYGGEGYGFVCMRVLPSVLGAASQLALALEGRPGAETLRASVLTEMVCWQAHQYQHYFYQFVGVTPGSTARERFTPCIAEPEAQQIFEGTLATINGLNPQVGAVAARALAASRGLDEKTSHLYPVLSWSDVAWSPAPPVASLTSRISYEGGLYAGDLLDGKPHGKGIFWNARCVYYAGDWRDGQRTGHGTAQLIDGALYEGDWRNNLRHGVGVYSTVKGSTMDRLGTITPLDHSRHRGNTYIGNWQRGKFAGPANQFIPAEGDFWYVGGYKASQRAGWGTIKGNRWAGDKPVYCINNVPHLPDGRTTVDAQAQEDAFYEAKAIAEKAAQQATYRVKHPVRSFFKDLLK